MRVLITILLCLQLTAGFAQKILNVFAWSGEVPKAVIHKFEHETGIRVNFSSYDSNEILYTKLKTSRRTIYDIIIPSSYFVERMHAQNMLSKINHQRLSNYHNLSNQFLNNSYDPHNNYSIPFVWGAAGIFYNAKFINTPISTWQQLWHTNWKNQLMLLDDAREMFSVALLKSGYPPNEGNPKHLHIAYQALQNLLPNIKLFSSDGIQANLIDEDAHIGVAWNGDVFKAQQENPAIHFIFPKEGFVIWIDCLAIPKNAPHLDAAYSFINFLLRPDIAAQIALKEGHALTNQAAIQLLPYKIRTNPIVYPQNDVLQRAIFQRDMGSDTMELINHYWQQFKLSV